MSSSPIAGREGHLTTHIRGKGTDLKLYKKYYFTTPVYHTFPDHLPITCQPHCSPNPEVPNPSSFVYPKLVDKANSNHPFGLLIAGCFHVYMHYVHIKWTFCCLFVYLSLTSMIYRVQTGEPRMGRGKDFFLLTPPVGYKTFPSPQKNPLMPSRLFTLMLFLYFYM